MSLRVDDFDAFHAAVHDGRAPFAWQERLVRTVDARRAWPKVIDLPTGAGKTTCIDIALFALVLDAGRTPSERWCARRIAMVVDRRVVVDQAAERGRLLLRRLLEAKDGVLLEVKLALRSLVGDAEEDPLAVYTLRGGIAKDDGWARTPHQPLILASTVDQLGSRILIQGYGVSRSMKPVHAGLLANDTLVLLDEVHLSRPFAQTLERLGSLRSASPHSPGMRPLQHVLLSATPGEVDAEVFRLDDAERDPISVLGKRLQAHKPARLREIGTRADLPAVARDEAHGLLERHDVVAVVVNRVASARDVASLLRNRISGSVDVVLLTGRMRPLDRDDVLAPQRDRIATGRDRAAVARKLIVVATQCIEAGADFDFDALVTESASLDALRQRFGRVDRLGSYGKSEGVILHIKDAKDDPIYGKALLATWKWLRDRSSTKRTIDFGIEALPSPAEPDDLFAPKKSAPTLLPAYLDLWSQTSPEPAVIPEVSLFLHGPDSGPPDVQIIWRADLLDEHLVRNDGSATAIVEAVRPSSLEAVSVPFVAARTWLAGRDQQPEIWDTEGSEEPALADLPSGHLALRWRGAESEVIRAGALRPGDTIVVPSKRGGLSNGTFDPRATEPAVQDLAERAALLARGRAVLRMHPVILDGLSLGSVEDFDDLFAAARAETRDASPSWRTVWLHGLTTPLRRKVVEFPDADLPFARWLVVEGQRRSAADLREALRGADAILEPGGDTSTDEEDSFYSGSAKITLARHSTDVERFAREYAVRLGLPPRLVAVLALAAWLHDIGKADARFQLLLRGGDEIALLSDETPWAKSSMPPGAKQAHDRARRRSRYPRGARHEVQSVAMLESIRDALRARTPDLEHEDVELALHLVGSHHGYCRPFAPPVVDEIPVKVSLPAHTSEVFGTLSFDVVSSDHGLHRLDSPLADRFWSLVERYGWLELCWLEAILRLADHRASEEEELDERS